MRSIADAFRERLQAVSLAAPQIPYLSNVTGTWITAAEAVDPDYWVRHVLDPVRFGDGIAELCRQPDLILLEVGPGNTLGGLASSSPSPAVRRLVLASLRRRSDHQPDEELLQKTLGRLWLAGAEVDWRGFRAGERRRRLPLPTYHFERRRFWIERRERSSEEAAARPQALAGKIEDRASWFHVPIWKSAARPAGAGSAPGSWLLLLDERGVGGELMRRLEAAGHEVIAARIGESFRRLGDRLFSLDPRHDFSSLFAAIGRMPERIVHLWTVDLEAAMDAQGFARAQELGFHALLSLVQALGKSGLGAPAEICAVAGGVLAVERGDGLRPEQATLKGSLQVISQEYPAIRCRMIDIDLGELGDGLVERLAVELEHPSPEPAVALRGARRWIPDFAPLRLEAGEPPLRDGGVYLITGGLGGIGLGLAELLAVRFRAKLVLTGRSACPDRALWRRCLAEGGEWSSRIRRLQALEEAGAEILVVSADVTDEARMKDVIARCLQRFGALHGVLHVAGLPGSGLIQLKTREEAERVQAPKTVGTLVLERVLAGLPLDFLALFSSATSIFGGVGQVDYTAANAFLDAFAERHAARSGRRTVAIDWGQWQWDAWTGSTMPGDPEMRRQIAGQRETYGLTFDEGLDALCRALASGLPRVIVLTRDFASYRRHSLSAVLATLQGLQGRDEAVRQHSRPALATPYLAPRTELERHLAAIWQELLGIEPVGIEDDFLEIGGHSLLALQAISRIQERLRADVSLNTLLEAGTIARLAALIAAQQLAAELSPEGDGALPGGARASLRDVDALSDEQVDGLLAEILARRNEVEV
jgi:acyl transferase domain-containing protein/acyl carrier protein